MLATSGRNIISSGGLLQLVRPTPAIASAGISIPACFFWTSWVLHFCTVWFTGCEDLQKHALPSLTVSEYLFLTSWRLGSMYFYRYVTGEPKEGFKFFSTGSNSGAIFATAHHKLNHKIIHLNATYTLASAHSRCRHDTKRFNAVVNAVQISDQQKYGATRTTAKLSICTSVHMLITSHPDNVKTCKNTYSRASNRSKIDTQRPWGLAVRVFVGLHIP